jgi:hypothetical protein
MPSTWYYRDSVKYIKLKMNSKYMMKMEKKLIKEQLILHIKNRKKMFQSMIIKIQLIPQLAQSKD